MQKQRKKVQKHNGHKDDLVFVGDLIIRDVRFDKVFEVHDRELKSALAMMERFMNDKLQADVTIRMLPREPLSKALKEEMF
jgi:ribosomal protein L16/L10AE